MASVDDIWLVDFGHAHPGEPAHHRPAVVIGPPDTFGANFPFAVLCPLSTTARGLSLHVEVEADEQTGLDDTSYVQCELLRSVSRRRLIHRIGSVDPLTSQQIHDIVRTLLNH